MLPISRLTRRWLATETKFSAGNGTPTAADILYRNPEAIKNRLQLFHLYRLQSQLRLDLPKLKGNHYTIIYVYLLGLKAMAKPWNVDEEKDIVRVTTHCKDNLPGIESQFDPSIGSVSISVPVEKLKLEKKQEELLLKLSGDKYSVDEGMIKFTVSDFPFKEQNQKRAIDILRDLLAYVKVKLGDILYKQLQIYCLVGCQ